MRPLPGPEAEETTSTETAGKRKSLAIGGAFRREPSTGIEPATPSLPSKRRRPKQSTGGQRSRGLVDPDDAFALRRSRGWPRKGPHGVPPLPLVALAAAGKVSGDRLAAPANSSA